MMDPDSIIFQYDNTELHVVPAIHFNHVFAEKVSRICHASAKRPEAVAVELGPRAAASAAQWLSELTAGHKSLPVMLGLLKRNRIIRASLRQKALQLQKDTGKDLSELSPELLKREFGYNGHSLLLLSPTDSIIEAIRCGVEYNMPVFGIDLDDMADGFVKQVQVQIPQSTHNLISYINSNVRIAEQQRDEEIDNRREVAMAARIKALSKNYRRILFTCGMAHWLRIETLLKDDSIKPSLMPAGTTCPDNEFRRVVVHPALAAQYMDLFPALSILYEKRRTTYGELFSFPDRRHCLDTEKVFHKQLMKAYKKYFKASRSLHQKTINNHDLEKLELFERYLRNCCLLDYRPVPDIFRTVQAARETMSSEFTQSLTKTFMSFPWASLDKFPDCSLLRPSSEERCDENSIELTDKNGYQGTKIFYIRSSSANQVNPSSTIPFEWDKTKTHIEKQLLSWCLHTWLPWDRLISTLSIQAIKYTNKTRIANRAINFEGSLMNGIDVKHTVRSFSRGDERYYVRTLFQDGMEQPNFVERFPVVWILQPKYDQEAEWNILHVPPQYLEKHIKDKTAFEHFVTKHGCNLTAVIGYRNCDREQSLSSKSVHIRCDRYAGIIIFQPICWTNKQFARWAQITGYRRAPFSNDSSFSNSGSDLSTYYREKHDIRIEEFHWTTMMMLLAIPFAKEILTVVTPNGFQIEKIVYRKAKQYGVQVRSVPHRLFSPAHLERLSRCYLAPVITCEPECEYAKEVERLIGEKQTDNLEMVPPFLRDFGNMG